MVATFFYIKKRKKHIMQMRKELISKQDELEKEKSELAFLLKMKQTDAEREKEKLSNINKEWLITLKQKEHEINEQMSNKQQIIERMKEEIDYLQSKIKGTNAVAANMQINDSDFIAKLKSDVHYLSRDEWKILHKTISESAPDFVFSLKKLCPLLREDEIDLCILIWMNFSIKEITFLVGKDYHYLVSTRNRLLKIIFQETHGGAPEFDRRIKSLI
jgi:DNA repair exonuclease SbcCD ATPase subunit